MSKICSFQYSNYEQLKANCREQSKQLFDIETRKPYNPASEKSGALITIVCMRVKCLVINHKTEQQTPRDSLIKVSSLK
jgi:hypothetical protein